jgi:L-2-hydroxyglutarate oxidase
MRKADVAIIGGGIVGLATGYRLSQRFPDFQVVVLEKEVELAAHQSGHNSGVLHSGIYYRPGSFKAKNCRVGKLAMQQFCDIEGIPYSICGKVIVATGQAQIPALRRLYERGQANGVKCALIDGIRLRELEPHGAGDSALYVPETGVVDYKKVCERLAIRIREGGGEIQLGAKVFGIERRGTEIVLRSTAGETHTKVLVNCAGLHSDRLMRLSGEDPKVRIVPFRGEYYKLKEEVRHLCNGLIYPVPDSRFPFLGVHITRTIHNSVECGPNAVLAFSREGYRKRDINFTDFLESVTYRGFLRLAASHSRLGLSELWRSLSKSAFAKALQELVPEIRRDHLIAAPAGVRAQALTSDGHLVDDFLIQDTDTIINVCNAPSPAATASLNIGNYITDKIEAYFPDRKR